MEKVVVKTCGAGVGGGRGVGVASPGCSGGQETGGVAVDLKKAAVLLFSSLSMTTFWGSIITEYEPLGDVAGVYRDML